MYIEVFTSKCTSPVAIIEEYPHDARHPNRKWCYRKGIHSHYSDTAETIEDMVKEFIDIEIKNWSFFGAHDISIKFVPHWEMLEE